MLAITPANNYDPRMRRPSARALGNAEVKLELRRCDIYTSGVYSGEKF